MSKNVAELCIYSDDTNVFDENCVKYVIPLYQRDFAWSEKEIEQLIEDISDIDETSDNYFLGSLIVARQKEFFEVIDGQQRLTSLYLLLNSLGIHTSHTLSFACREKSNYTLVNIQQILDSEKVRLLDEEKLDESILAGTRIIRAKQQEPGFDKEEFIAKLKTVRLYRIEVPKNTDLNRYFEIMNTRGEQLEQHDILKASLMRTLNSEAERAVFANIWDACSDMTGYVQMHFGVKVRNALFGNEWKSCPVISNYSDELISDEKNTGKNIQDLIDDIGFKIQQDDGINEDNDRVRFESIIEFPYFLLHTLRVFAQEKEIVAKPDGGKLIDELLDDKKLVVSFDRVLENGTFDGKAIDKREFSLGFIECLLKTRFLLDKYIIKREYTNDNPDGEWSLKELRFSYSGKNGRSYYANTEYKVLKEWYQEKRSEERCRINIMLQSCLRVSYTSPKIMHWITELLTWGFHNNSANLSKLDQYQVAAEAIAKQAVKEQFLSIGNYNQGVNTPHIVFNYLDYLLWKKGGGSSSFVFEFRNSVEHWYPRNPSEGTFEKWTYDDGVDHFGNLCLIQRNVNSKFSNLAPEAKKTTYKDMISKGSLKLRMMAEQTVSSDGENSSQRWKKGLYLKHGEEMIRILKDALNWQEEPPISEPGSKTDF